MKTVRKKFRMLFSAHPMFLIRARSVRENPCPKALSFCVTHDSASSLLNMTNILEFGHIGTHPAGGNPVRCLRGTPFQNED